MSSIAKKFHTYYKIRFAQIIMHDWHSADSDAPKQRHSCNVNSGSVSSRDKWSVFGPTKPYENVLEQRNPMLALYHSSEI